MKISVGIPFLPVPAQVIGLLERYSQGCVLFFFFFISYELPGCAVFILNSNLILSKSVTVVSECEHGPSDWASSLGCEKKGNNLVKCTAKMRSLQRVYLILSCWKYHYHGRSQLFLENKAACWRISTIIHSAIWERKVIEVSWSAADFPSCAGTVTVCEGNLYPHIGLPFARCATHR